MTYEERKQLKILVSDASRRRAIRMAQRDRWLHHMLAIYSHSERATHSQIQGQ